MTTTKFKNPKHIRDKVAGYMRERRRKIKLGLLTPTPSDLRNKTKNPHYSRDYYRVVKDDVINHYSKGKNECNCCKEKIREFLALDHMYGNGMKHRREIKVNLYWWCKKNNYPKGFQVLCHNCNMAWGFHGLCPHKKDKIPK